MQVPHFFSVLTYSGLQLVGHNYSEVAAVGTAAADTVVAVVVAADIVAVAVAVVDTVVVAADTAAGLHSLACRSEQVWISGEV